MTEPRGTLRIRSVGRFTLVSVVLLVLAVGSPFWVTPAGAGEPLSRRGTYEGGRYLIEVPADWNGGLVLYASGPLARTLRVR
jgi:hypothetical protein